MKKSDLDKFFLEVEKRLQQPVEIYLTGGVLAWFYGGVRPTLDIDFALKTGGKWEEASRVLREVGQRLGIPLEYSEDISRWGMIGYSNFTEGARLYKKFGALSVYTLDPLVWSVGKLSRYTADDLSDLLAVFKKQKPDPDKVVRVWAQALLESPRSTEHHLFVKKVEDFLSFHGKEIWGKSFDFSKRIEDFRARLRHLTKE